MSFIETDEHRVLRAAVRAIASNFGHDYFLRCVEDKRFTDELWTAIFQQGFGAVNLPQAYGGGGSGFQEMAIVIEELAAQGCPLLFLIVAGMCGPVINQFGTDEQKQYWLPRIAEGSFKMAFAITESDAGSNMFGIKTAARRDGDCWVLRGTKQYITGIDVADAVLVVARTGSTQRNRAELSLFIVDVDSPGLAFTPIPMAMQVPDNQNSVYLDDVRVDGTRLIGGVPGQGTTQIFSSLNPERISVAAQATGLSRYFINKATSYAKQRAVWGVPIGTHQGVAHPLAEARIDMELARLMMQKAAWLFDNGMEVGEAAGMAKVAAADAVLKCFDQAIQIHGGNAFASEYGLADLWGLTRLMRNAPVSREMVLNYVAQHCLGLPRSY
ncbi:acyl-CoA dehydrogenase family protein [Mycobacterium branderi]|uniref:Acyl-CoA dehydrogenase n=1 Tax=Mycobacterium branderi TaxID=43348 RepID=A0A7I7WIF7_9MYCO|nr:acyl-CoA dehydrogenase family protein [Mycobacterium branderi]MCV7231720.1 acyl-CoA/acyl-ACP dehydrogenase [Mycobacterium branderi]ORA40309.1 acyl-CoA dehydrogenase [Mycobacterium branderi]BBZ15628.1 putative acyl-CoA dehydrogenase FadE [Mycobacterium branderi]